MITRLIVAAELLVLVAVLALAAIAAAELFGLTPILA